MDERQARWHAARIVASGRARCSTCNAGIGADARLGDWDFVPVPDGKWRGIEHARCRRRAAVPVEWLG